MREFIRTKAEIEPRDVTPLSSKEEQELVQKFVSQKDNQAVQKEFLESFEWIVEKIIATYFQHISPNDVDDVRQVARMALISAAEKFDPHKGVGFSWFAKLVIWRDVYRWQKEQTGIAIPLPVIKDIERIEEYLSKHETLETKDEEIMAGLEFDRERFKRAMAARKFMKTLSLQQVLEKRERSEDDSAISQDEYVENLDDLIHSIVVNDTVNVALEHTLLSDREKEVIKKRFGLYGEEEQTFEQLADLFGVTRERIRQIEHNALEKVRIRCPIALSERQKKGGLFKSLDEAGFSKDIIALLKRIRWYSGRSEPEKREIYIVYDLVKSLCLYPNLSRGIKNIDIRQIIATLNENHISARLQSGGIYFDNAFLIKLRNFAREHDKEFASKL